MKWNLLLQFKNYIKYKKHLGNIVNIINNYIKMINSEQNIFGEEKIILRQVFIMMEIFIQKYGLIMKVGL